jgi:hypothetical protein
MTKGCGCDKKPKGDRPIWVFNKKPKGEPNQIWKYVQGFKPKPTKNNLPSYYGSNGFSYNTNIGKYVVFFTFSIINNDTIIYFITLSKIESIKINKNTNITTRYLKCTSQFTYESKVNSETIKKGIANLSNSDFSSFPDNTDKFNIVIVNAIKNAEKTTAVCETKGNPLVGSVLITPQVKNLGCGSGNGECQ